MAQREARPAGRAVTRADVARYAGVSTAVVSYVVNNGPKAVAPDTAARVRRAVELLDYRPNVNAQALRKGTTEMLGLVLSDPTNPFFTEFAAAIGTEAFEYGHALMIATAGSSPDTETRLIDDLVRRQVDGLIVASVFGRPDLALSRTSRDAAIVWIDARGPVPGYPSVGSDSQAAARLGVEHLVAVHGHRSVGLVVGASDGPDPDPREQGWQAALHAADLDDGPVARVAWSREGGYEGGRRLLRSRNPPTAVFASSDLQAIGLLRAAHERGLNVPGDLAVVGFDGTKESEYCWPPLTVVAQPIFPAPLVVRQSCGCAPEASVDGQSR
jgi:LacI family transcriptional regulator